MEIPSGVGRGFGKLKFLKESIKLNCNFKGGWTDQTRKPSMAGVWRFSGTTHYMLL